MSTTEIINVLGIDGRLNPSSRKNRTNVILQGGSSTSFLRTSTQNASPANVGFTVTVPNARTYLPRIVYLQLAGTTTFNGTSRGAGAGNELLQCPNLPHSAFSGTFTGVGTDYGFAPRCDPLNQAITQTLVDFNGWQLSSNTNAYARILQWFHRSTAEENTELALSPMMPDMSLNYSDLQGSAKNPLNGYQYNVLQDPRGSYPNVCVVGNTSFGPGAPGTDVAVVNWNFITPIILSPFIYTKNYQESLAFIQVTKLDFNFLLGGRGNGPLGGLSGALWSIDPSVGGTITSMSTTIETGACFLYNQFIYPPDWQAIPRQVNYSYSNPTFLPNTQSVIAAGAAGVSTQSVAIQRNTTMNQIFLWAGERDSDMNVTKTDANYFSINNISCQFDSGAPQLSTMSQYDLYQRLYVDRGGKMSWRQWGGLQPTGLGGAKFGPSPVYDTTSSGMTLGSAGVCILPGIDITLERGDAPGCGNQKHTLLFTVSVTNISDRDIIPQINVLIIDEGVFQIEDLNARANVAIFGPADVKSIDTQTPISYITPASVLGGSFFSDLIATAKRLIRPGINIAKALAPPQLQGIIGAVDKVSEALGTGMNDGYGLVGGAKLSKNKLSKLSKKR